MSLKKSVDIEIHSKSDDQAVVQKVKGELYLRDEFVYIKYKEPDYEMGTTSTMMKLKPGYIKIIRHGDVQSEQEFLLHEKTYGFYYTPQGRMGLETYTHSLLLQLKEGIGSVQWSYDLKIWEDETVAYALRLEIREQA
jgi:uncharacterized beta-barrel protein YwiB (DUF1934 family)